MNKAVLLFVCMVTMFCSFAQDTSSETSKPVLTKEDYLKKSKGQRTAAIVMLSTGGAMTIAGLVMVSNELEENTIETNQTLMTVFIIGGPALMLGSIGFFVPAHKNKQKAMSLSFKNEPAPQLQRGMVFYKTVPSLSLKIRL